MKCGKSMDGVYIKCRGTSMHVRAGFHGHARATRSAWSAHGPVQCLGGTTVMSIFSVSSMITFVPKACMHENKMRKIGRAHV